MTTPPTCNPSTSTTNDPAVSPPTLPKVASRLLAAGLIFLIGLILLFVPLICSALQLDIVQGVSAVLIFLALLCCLSGVAIAVSEVIAVEATAKPTLVLFGRPIPIAIRGQIVVVVIFLSIGVSAVLLTDLHHRFDHYDDYLILERDHATLQGEKAHITRTAALLGEVLSGPHTEELHMLKLSVMCGDESHQYMSKWHTIHMESGSQQPLIFDATEAPLPVPVARESTEYRFGEVNFRRSYLTVTVALTREGVLDGKLHIRDAKLLDETCKQYVKNMVSPIHPTGGDLADGPSKVHD